jgi:dimethylhistidine N-methyltransferase
MSDSTVVLHDSLPGQEQFRLDVIGWLRSIARALPCKYFYDETGSKLFDDICELEEYYPTRTEMSIMSENIEAMTNLIGKGARLVEFGSGSSLKTRLLLNELNSLAAYVPIDISKDYLQFSAETLKREYPDLTVQPVCADYTHPFTIPSPDSEPAKTVVYFPGSTIGNFHSEEAEAFLGQIADLCGRGGGLLIGFDLHKSSEILEPAYNDNRGVTAEFNLNLLRRINRDLDADFDLEDWRHQAVYNEVVGRIEMYLISNRDHSVRIGSTAFKFKSGDRILTECSYKYTQERFEAMADRVGLKKVQSWTDARSLFCVQFLAVE